MLLYTDSTGASMFIALEIFIDEGNNNEMAVRSKLKKTRLIMPSFKIRGIIIVVLLA
jgi:hypothetical protein